MKNKSNYYLYAIGCLALLIVSSFFIYRLFDVKKSIHLLDGGFNRSVADTINLERANWKTLSSLTRDSKAFIHIDKNHDSLIGFYPIPIGIHPLTTAIYNDSLYFALLDSQKIYKQNTSKPSIKLPSYTFRCLIDPYNGFIYSKKLDPSSGISSLLKTDMSGMKISEFTSCFKGIDAGGLSIDGYLASIDSVLYFISRYTNKIFKINTNARDNSFEFASIEKIDQLPIVVRKGNSYSFKHAPFLVHSGAFPSKEHLVLVSNIRDNAGREQKLKDFIYLDLYSINDNAYEKSYLLLNLNLNPITDIRIIRDSLIITKNNEYATFKIR